MEIITKKLSELTVCPYNPRVISDEALAGLTASLTEYGCVQPIIWNKRTGNVVGGNQRLKVLRAQGDADTEVVVVDLPLGKEKALNIALNSPHISGDWTPGLGDLLDEIKLELPDLYEGLLLDDLLADVPGVELEPYVGETDPDDVPEPVAEPVIQWGDLVVLGRHRLLCGDSCKAEDVSRLMAGKKAENVFVFADAPYGIDIVSTDKAKSSIGFGGKLGFVGGGGIVLVNAYKPIKGDKTTKTAKDFYELCLNLKINKFVLWGGNYFTGFLPSTPCWIVWDKRGDVPSNNFADCEIAWTNFNSPSRIYKQIWSGLLREGKRKDELVKRIHPTQKPVGLAEWCLNQYAQLDDIIFDGFLGSGQTLIACEKTNHVCLGVEIEESYCQMIIERYINFTGRPEDVTVERAGKRYKWGELEC